MEEQKIKDVPKYMFKREETQLDMLDNSVVDNSMVGSKSLEFPDLFGHKIPVMID